MNKKNLATLVTFLITVPMVNGYFTSKKVNAQAEVQVMPSAYGTQFLQMGSGRCLTIPDLSVHTDGLSNGTFLFLYDCYRASDNNQFWKYMNLKPAKRESFIYLFPFDGQKSRHKKCLMSPTNSENEAKVFIQDCNESDTRQQWFLQPEKDRYYRIVNVGSKKCLTTPDLGSDPNGSKNGAKVFMYDCYKASGTGYNQLWKNGKTAGSAMR
jgi:hypothetical protein